MKDQRFTLGDKCHIFFLSFFGVGNLPKAPGTFGSLATIPLILLLKYLNTSFTMLLIIVFTLLIISSFSAHYIQNKFEVSDPSWIVIDEVLGMLTTWLFVFPATDYLSLLSSFILFRLFDITKIFPISWCDKNIKNGFGTMLDDIIAALFAGFFLLLIKQFLNLL